MESINAWLPGALKQAALGSERVLGQKMEKPPQM